MAGKIRVLFFAAACQEAGCAEISMACEAAGMNEEEFWKRLVKSHPRLDSLKPSVRLARNHEFLSAGELLQPGDEVALIPPVSGG